MKQKYDFRPHWTQMKRFDVPNKNERVSLLLDTHSVCNLETGEIESIESLANRITHKPAKDHLVSRIREFRENPTNWNFHWLLVALNQSSPDYWFTDLAGVCKPKYTANYHVN